MPNEPLSPTAAKEKIGELVDRFRTNIEHFKSPNYTEASVRADFIDKFFVLLGWDMDNTAGLSERYREVVREKTNNQNIKPDYAFKIGNKTVFAVEVKKPSVNIKDESVAAFQLRRYGYSAQLPLSILTNFAEFAVYDSRTKPNENDTAATARIFYYRFDKFLDKCVFPDYETNLDYIVALFARENVRKGNFDRYVALNANC